MTKETSLLSKTLSLGKNKVTVHKKTFGMQLERFTLLEAAGADAPVEGDGLAALIRNNFHRVLYPSLKACTTGNVPTEQECFDGITNDELDAWLQAAREMNPDWFPIADVTQEQEAKNE